MGSTGGIDELKPGNGAGGPGSLAGRAGQAWLRSTVDELGSLVEDLEPGLVTASDAGALVSVFARLERLAGAGKALCATRAAEVKRVWSRGGEKSPGHWMAKADGSKVGASIGTLEALEGLGEAAPQVEQAYRRGDLSGDQLRAIAPAAKADPAKAGELVAAAGTSSLKELQGQARQVFHAAQGEDAEARHRRIHANRFLRTGVADDGTCWGRWNTTADKQAAILEALRPFQDLVFAEARTEGRRESSDAYAVDALARLADASLDNTVRPVDDDGGGDDEAHTDAASPASAASPTSAGSARRGRRSKGSLSKVIVHIDSKTLATGTLSAGGRCEIAGVGPVPPSVVREWIDEGAFVAAVVRDGMDIRTVTHLGRHATVFQRTALEAISPMCSVLGCSTEARLEIDHRRDWADTHHTTLDELDLLCPHHHDLKTHHGYALAPGTGKRPLLPPHEAGPPPLQGTSPPPHGTGPPADSPATPSRDSSTAFEQATLLDAG